MANQSPTIAWQREVGINHTPAYQVSGAPYAIAGTNAATAQAISFPYVTRWFTIINRSANPVRIGFSELGVSGSNYFTVDASGSAGYGTTGVLEMKVSDLWLYSPAKATLVDVVAGLTSIDRNKTSGSVGPSWSGSAGVG